MADFLLVERDGKQYRLPTKRIEDIRELKPLLSEKGWLIYNELALHESYPAEIAKKLKMQQQEAYYYFNQLKNAGLIEVSRKEERRGGLAKFYSAKEPSFALIPALKHLGKKSEFTSFQASEKGLEPGFKKFFSPFIEKGELNAKIVVGAPDSHGEFKARARDSHLAVEFACFLGSLAERIRFPLVFLDTMMKPLREENSNLIVIGGPITNKTSNELNEFLPVRFAHTNGSWHIESSLSGKHFIDDSIGVIEKIKHPFHDGKSVLFVAGKRNAGTKAAILSLMQQTDEIIKPNPFGKAHARVVEGLDLDSDGVIDAVELRE